MTDLCLEMDGEWMCCCSGGRDISPFNSEEPHGTDHLGGGGPSSLWQASANPPQRAGVMKQNRDDGRPSGKHILRTLSTPSPPICYFSPSSAVPSRPVASPSLSLSIPLSPLSAVRSLSQQTDRLSLISRERGRYSSSRNTN